MCLVTVAGVGVTYQWKVLNYLFESHYYPDWQHISSGHCVTLLLANSDVIFGFKPFSDLAAWFVLNVVQ